MAQEAVPATGHKEEVLAEKAATCTEKGLTEGKYCSVCKVTLVAQQDVDETGHTEIDVDAVAPTCTKDGHEKGTKCSVCDVVISGCAVVEATNHAYTTVSIPGRAATCTQSGIDDGMFCAACGKIIKAQAVTPATGHDYVKIEKVDPKCTETGLTEHTKCTKCDSLSSIPTVLPEKGHTEEDIPAVAATCETAGKTKGSKCVVCGEITVAQKDIPALGHKEVIIPVVDATCTAAGTTAGVTCSVCEKALIAQEAIPALGHKEVTIPAVEATCTETGLTEGKYCSACNETLVAQETVPATGHTEEIIPAVEATCTETGLTEGKKCSVCDEILVAQTETPANGHTEESVDAVAATCTETGLTAGVTCEVCGAMLSAQQVVAALGHTDEVMSAVAPTCTETGLTEGAKCSVCDEILVEQNVVDAPGHTEVILGAVAPACTATGLTEGKYCSVCKEILVAQQTVDALGHDLVITEAVAATCLTDGNTYGEKCNRCDYEIESQVIPAAGHTEEVVPAVDETFTANGSTQGLICSVCDEVFVAVQDVPAKIFGMVDDANTWAQDNGADALLAAQTSGADLTLEIKVDAIWGDNDVADSAFDGLLTNIGSYLDDNFGASSIVKIDGEEVYSDGKLRNTAVKNTVFNVGEGFFYNIANLGADGVYGTYDIEVTSTANGTDVTENIEFEVVFAGEKLDTIKEFAAVVAEHIAMNVVDGNAVIDIEAPEKLVEALNGTYCETSFTDAELGDVLANIAAYDTADIFGSKVTAMDKLASTLCGFDSVINKVVGKVTSATITVKGVELELLAPDATFAPKGEVKDFGVLVEALTAMIDGEVLGLAMDMFEVGNDTYQFPVTVSIDMGNLGGMDSDIITETVIFNVHIPVAEPKTVSEKLETVATRANEWSDANLGGLITAAVADDDLMMDIDVDVIWEDEAINADAFDGLLTNLGKYIDEEFGIAVVSIDGEEIFSDGKLHNTAVKNAIFNVGEGFFYNIANLDADGIYGTYEVVADGETFTLTVSFAGDKLETIKSFAATAAEHISMNVVDGDTVLDIQMPEAYMKNACGDLTPEELYDMLDNVTVADFVNELARQGAEGTFGSQQSAINKISSMLCGNESVVNKVLDKVTEMTVNIDGVEVNVLEDGAAFEPKAGSVQDFTTLMSAVGAMLSDDFGGLYLGMLREDNKIVFPVTVTVDMGNLDAMDNSTITETIIINLNLF